MTFVTKSAAQVHGLRPDVPFKGKYLVVASDTDMLPSAYTDQNLGPYAGKDQLSVIQIDQPAGKLTSASVPVSNSVIGPPSSVALSGDGRIAVVIETRGQRSDPGPEAKLATLPTGRKITVVDMKEPGHPKVVQVVDAFDDPLSVSINYTGTLVCVVFKQAGPVTHPLLAFYRLLDGHLSAPVTPAIPGPESGDALVSAEFHPKENILGLLYTQHPRLALVKVGENGNALHLEQWGAPVNVDISPFLVRFTPDGRFALINAMLPGAVRGTVTSIRLGGEGAAKDAPLHAIVSRAEAGILPEGFAISPDERWVVTTNLEHSTAALGTSDQGYYASLTLMHFDALTGLLKRVGDFPFDGRLPEAVVFDNSSRFLAVACFAHYDPAKPGGSIDFWRLATDPVDATRTELVKLDVSIPVARGPHSMVIARSK